MRNRVQIIAPSSRTTNAEQEVETFAKALTERGFCVKPLDPELFSKDWHYYANSFEKRLSGLREGLLDPEIDILWVFRGGYGAGEIAIPAMETRPSHQKILIGYSDITFLHGLFNQVYKMPSIHGSGMRILQHPSGFEDVWNILKGKPVHLSLTALNQAAESVSLSGPLTGGNLSVLVTMIGTKLHPDTRGKILLLEDVGEKGYRIARMLNHLSQTECLDEIKAIIFGDFTESDEHLDFALKDFRMRNSHIPIFSRPGIGHGDVNIPIPLGASAIIQDGILRVESPF